MYVCVHCSKEQKHCRCTSPFTTPKTLHNFPGQRYNFWADYADLPEGNIFEQISNTMWDGLFRTISQAFMIPRELFEPTIKVNWDPTPTKEDLQALAQSHTTQVVRKMRVPVYSWNCGYCQEEGNQEPYTVDHPFKVNCCHCGQEYTATQIINSLAYNTDYEWKEV